MSRWQIVLVSIHIAPQGLDGTVTTNQFYLWTDLKNRQVFSRITRIIHNDVQASLS
jgi:hypothetical protein